MQPSVIFLVSSIPIQKGYSSVIRKAVKVSRFDLQELRGPWPEDPVAMERALKLLKIKEGKHGRCRRHMVVTNSKNRIFIQTFVLVLNDS